MIILLSVTVFVCHDKGNVFFCTINSPVYVYWKQEKLIFAMYNITKLIINLECIFYYLHLFKALY